MTTIINQLIKNYETAFQVVINTGSFDELNTNVINNYLRECGPLIEASDNKENLMKSINDLYESSEYKKLYLKTLVKILAPSDIDLDEFEPFYKDVQEVFKLPTLAKAEYLLDSEMTKFLEPSVIAKFKEYSHSIGRGQ